MQLKFGEDFIDVSISGEGLKDFSENPDNQYFVEFLKVRCSGLNEKMREHIVSQKFIEATSVEAQIKIIENIIDFITEDLSESLKDLS